ncbi:MAG: hypothetical protein ACRYFX_13460 [Janthinobacterium lividum]
MPRAATPAASPQPDPALVAFFQGSGKSYDENVDDLLQRLDAAAAYTRAQRAARAARATRLAANAGRKRSKSG